MKDNIVQTLPYTYSGNSVKEAEDSLMSLFRCDKNEFILSLVEVFQDDSIDSKIRHSALIYITRIAFSFWEQIPTETKNFIYHFIQSSIPIVCDSMRKSLFYLSKIVVSKSYIKNEWYEFRNIVINGFSVNTIGDRLVSLVLVNSVCSKIKNIPKRDIEILNELKGELFGLVVDSISENCSGIPYHLSLHILSRIIGSEISINNDSLCSLTYLLITKSNTFLHNTESLYRALKVFNKILARQVSGISNECLLEIFSICNSGLRVSGLPKIYCVSLSVVRSILVDYNEELKIGVSFIDFLIQELYPLFRLTKEEISFSEFDPSRFVSENHRIGDSFEDPRSAASTVIYQYFQNNHHDLHLFLGIINESVNDIISINHHDPDQISSLFSVLRMFASVSNFAYQIYPDEVGEIITNLSSLASSTEHLLRASVFMTLSQTKLVCQHDSVADILFNHFFDDSRLVQYYSFVAASHFISNKDNCEKTIELLSGVTSSIDELFKHLLDLSNEFFHIELSESLFHFVSIFGSLLLPVSFEIANEIMAIILNSSQVEGSDGFTSAIMSMQPLQEMISILSKNNAYEFLHLIFQRGIQLVQELTRDDVLCEFIPTLRKTLWLNQFSELNWEYFDFILPFLKDRDEDIIWNFAQLIETMIIKDNDFSKRSIKDRIIEIVMQLLDESKDSIELFSCYLLIYSTLLNKCPELYEQALQYVEIMVFNINDMNVDDHFTCSSVTFISAMIQHYQTSFTEWIDEDNIPIVLEYWIDLIDFPKSIKQLPIIYAYVQSDECLKRSLLSHSLDCILPKLLKDTLEEDIGEDDDYATDDDISNSKEFLKTIIQEEKEILMEYLSSSSFSLEDIEVLYKEY